MPDGRICWSGRYKETASCIKAGIGGFSRTMWDLIKPIFSNRNTIKPNNSRSIGYVCDGDCLSNQRRLSTYFCVSQLVSCVLLVVWLQSHTTRHCFMLPVSQIKYLPHDWKISSGVTCTGVGMQRFLLTWKSIKECAENITRKTLSSRLGWQMCLTFFNWLLP